MHDPGPILCGVGDEPTFPHVAAARKLADLLGCPVRFAHVLTMGRPVVAGDDRRGVSVPAASLHLPDKLLDQRVEGAHHLLLRAGARPHERRVTLGAVAPALLRLAQEERSRMIVTGTRGRGRLKAALAGSVSRELMRTARCPVMSVPDMGAPPFAGGAVVCGVDAGPELGRVVLAASDLAEQIDRPLVLAHVVESVEPAAAAAPHAVVSAAFDRISQQAAARAVELLGRAVERVPPHVRAELAVRSGTPADGLLSLADELDADLVVIGAKGHGAVSTALLGSTALEVTTHARGPVLVVPPQDIKAR